MKNILFVTLVLVIFTSCTSRENRFVGYIPENEETKMVFINDSINKMYDVYALVNVVIGNDTLSVTVSPRPVFFGSNFVLYKGKHPLTINKKVFVRVYKEKGEYMIVEGSLDTLRKW